MMTCLMHENRTLGHQDIRDIRNLSEHKEEEDYYKSVRVGNFWNNNYMKQYMNNNNNIYIYIMYIYIYIYI